MFCCLTIFLHFYMDIKQKSAPSGFQPPDRTLLFYLPMKQNFLPIPAMPPWPGGIFYCAISALRCFRHIWQGFFQSVRRWILLYLPGSSYLLNIQPGFRLPLRASCPASGAAVQSPLPGCSRFPLKALLLLLHDLRSPCGCHEEGKQTEPDSDPGVSPFSCSFYSHGKSLTAHCLAVAAEVIRHLRGFQEPF